MNFRISEKSAQKLKKAGVGMIYLFGSEVQKTTDFESDFDIGIVLINPSVLFKPKKFLSYYHQLYEIISEILPKSFKGKLDLVFLQKASYSLQFEAINYGKVLYEISPLLRADYEEKVLKNYLDFKPLLEEFYQAILKRVR